MGGVPLYQSIVAAAVCYILNRVSGQSWKALFRFRSEDLSYQVHCFQHLKLNWTWKLWKDKNIKHTTCSVAVLLNKKRTVLLFFILMFVCFFFYVKQHLHQPRSRGLSSDGRKTVVQADHVPPKKWEVTKKQRERDVTKSRFCLSLTHYGRGKFVVVVFKCVYLLLLLLVFFVVATVCIITFPWLGSISKTLDYLAPWHL